MAGGSSAVRGLISKASGSRAGAMLSKEFLTSTRGRVALGLGAAATGYAAVNAYANNRDASQVNMFGAGALGGMGGVAAVMRNRRRQGQSLFTSPGNVNNHLFPGGGDQGIG